MSNLQVTITVLFTALLSLCVAQDDDCSWIISKSAWGGKPSKEVQYMKIPIEYAIIQHTVSPSCNSLQECVDRVVNIQTYHMDNMKWHDIGFSFLVGGDGNVYEGAGWHQVGAHTKGYNVKSIGIALIGNFNNALPPRPQLNAVRRLLDCGVKTGRLSENFKLLGHRQVVATQSPGLALYMEIQHWPEWVEQP